jgi:hypothetical protein
MALAQVGCRQYPQNRSIATHDGHSANAAMRSKALAARACWRVSVTNPSRRVPFTPSQHSPY